MIDLTKCEPFNNELAVATTRDLTPTRSFNAWLNRREDDDAYAAELRWWAGSGMTNDYGILLAEVV